VPASRLTEKYAYSLNRARSHINTHTHTHTHTHTYPHAHACMHKRTCVVNFRCDKQAVPPNACECTIASFNRSSHLKVGDSDGADVDCVRLWHHWVPRDSLLSCFTPPCDTECLASRIFL